MNDQMKSSWYILYNENKYVYTLSTDTFRPEQVDTFCTDKLRIDGKIHDHFSNGKCFIVKKNRWDTQVDPKRI